MDLDLNEVGVQTKASVGIRTTAWWPKSLFLRVFWGNELRWKFTGRQRIRSLNGIPKHNEHLVLDAGNRTRTHIHINTCRPIRRRRGWKRYLRRRYLVKCDFVPTQWRGKAKQRRNAKALLLSGRVVNRTRDFRASQLLLWSDITYGNEFTETNNSYTETETERDL